MEPNNNNNNVELIQIAIQRLIDDQHKKKKTKKKKKRIRSFNLTKSNHDVHDNDDDEDDDDRILLSRLLSQLESLKGAERQVDKEIEVVDDQVKDIDVDDDDDIVPVLVEVKEEIRKLKKQNTITHCLLSVMILLTLAWQYSEVSLILRIKSRFTDPFKSVGDMFNGMFKPRPPLLTHPDDANNKTSSSSANNDAPLLPLPKFDLSSVGLDADED